jgi:hypothetical protein
MSIKTADLFKVDGIVAVITGGGTGRLLLSLPNPARSNFAIQASVL